MLEFSAQNLPVRESSKLEGGRNELCYEREMLKGKQGSFTSTNRHPVGQRYQKRRAELQKASSVSSVGYGSHGGGEGYLVGQLRVLVQHHVVRGHPLAVAQYLQSCHDKTLSNRAQVNQAKLTQFGWKHQECT